MFITESFKLPREAVEKLARKTVKFGFNGFGEVAYYRTYSRLKEDGSQESWLDTVVRAIEGNFSIRKTHMINNRLHWRDEDWYDFAYDMADFMFDMKFLPPGRGLQMSGTEYLAERGAMALYNCAATEVDRLSHDASWLMDLSMCGVGVGFSTQPQREINLNLPSGDPVRHVVGDSREGWVESVRLLLESYEKGSNPVEFDYSMVRPAGSPIRGFGGTASGPGILQNLHERLNKYCHSYALGYTTQTRLIADVMNAIGACVIAGNLRRSAEIALGSPHDEEFKLLKDFDKYDSNGDITYHGSRMDRIDIGHTSNNSVILRTHEDFLALPDIADRIINNGEPGVFNLVNIQKYGRMFREHPDAATLSNPCGEIPLESKEVCNLVEVFPTKCRNREELFQAMRYATFYASTVALLPTHSEETNRIVSRNRRIGVSISGVADWIEAMGIPDVTRILRDGYRVVREENEHLAREAGVPSSIRVTTIKPSGTISQLAGVSSGMHWPTFRYAIRRIRVGTLTPISDVLIRSGVPHEPDVRDPENTMVFSFPIDQGKTRAAQEVSVWEQASRVAFLQREWADNMVSNTLYFDPETEAKHLPHLLAEFAPVVKTMSLLPHTEKGAYQQMPYEGIDGDEYRRRLVDMPTIDWSQLSGNEVEQVGYCSNDSCEVDFSKLYPNVEIPS